MRVLLVSKACLVGTYQTKLEAIARNDEVELTVIVPSSWQDSAGVVELERSHTDGYQLFVDPIRFNGHYHIHYYPRMKERLSGVQPHILHIDEEPYNFATWRAMREARKYGVKSLFFSWQNIERRYPFPFSLMEKQSLAMADYAIFGNKESQNVWKAKGYSGPSAVIPQFGIDPELFKAASHRDEGRGFNIGSAARRLIPEKGLDLLLMAVSEMDGLWRLHIAGEGPERPYLERLAQKLGIAERVYFDGPIPSAAMPAYLSQLDVLVVPSRTMLNWKEQFGRVLIEAMACQVAVIGSNSGEIPNVIAQAGLIFPEEDVEALRNHLSALQKHPDMLESYKHAGRRRVLDHYTQEQVAAQTVEIYKQMMTFDMS
ncbi:MAG: glycosyltransferase [Candidatus Promineifilaceae bacterium]